MVKQAHSTTPIGLTWGSNFLLDVESNFLTLYSLHGPPALGGRGPKTQEKLQLYLLLISITYRFLKHIPLAQGAMKILHLRVYWAYEMGL